jgi:hypothetical protein
MTDQTPPVEGAPTAAPEADKPEGTDVEKQAFLDRLSKESAKRKDAEKRAATVEKELADIRTKLEEKESAGLPEVEQLRKRLEAAEKAAEKAQALAEEREQAITRSQRERLVLAAAKDLDDPTDALRYPEHVDLDAIEDADQAERAVKRLVKAKPRLLKDDGPKQPQIGRVLENGKTSSPKSGGIDLDAEAQMVADNLKQFLANRR